MFSMINLQAMEGVLIIIFYMIVSTVYQLLLY